MSKKQFEGHEFSSMHLFVLNLVIMLAWPVLTVGFNLANFVVGFVLVWFLLFFTRSLYGNTVYFKKPFVFVKFVAVFIYRLFASSVWVILEVLRVTRAVSPGIVEVPLDVKTDMQLLLLTSYISLTPGTLSLDVDVEKNVLYVHAMFIDDPDAVRNEIKQTIEKDVLELTA